MHPDEIWALFDAKEPNDDDRWAELYDMLD